jgi:hypothetical protein
MGACKQRPAEEEELEEVEEEEEEEEEQGDQLTCRWCQKQSKSLAGIKVHMRKWCKMRPDAEEGDGNEDDEEEQEPQQHEDRETRVQEEKWATAQCPWCHQAFKRLKTHLRHCPRTPGVDEDDEEEQELDQAQQREDADEGDDDEGDGTGSAAAGGGERRRRGGERELVVGSRVEAHYGISDDEAWWPGTITRLCTNGDVDVQYDDGDFEARKPRRRVRPCRGAAAASTASTATHTLMHPRHSHVAFVGARPPRGDSAIDTHNDADAELQSDDDDEVLLVSAVNVH